MMIGIFWVLVGICTVVCMIGHTIEKCSYQICTHLKEIRDELRKP